MPYYTRADREVCDLIIKVMKKYHGQLSEKGVTVDCLFAWPNQDRDGNPKEAAIRLHGKKCHAVISIMKLKDRVAGRSDTELLIDGDDWEAFTKETRIALIDHELTHLELKPVKDGQPQTDDFKRPLLRIRNHDVEVGWFDSVLRRHGADSLEAIQSLQLFRDDKARSQLYFPFLYHAEYK